MSPPPAGSAPAANAAVSVGLLVLAGSAGAVSCGYAFAHSRSEHADLRHWEQEWQRFERDWTHRGRA
ncbi:hypothetical protein GXW82_18695 [Streptacidiphilus sp. 4-A2]|nr:hypothetical protein [Streptacidiphilus sp. 4-A2]